MGEGNTRRESLAERTGLNFIPLYSPSSWRPEVDPGAQVMAFDPDEIAIFQTRFEEGYDVGDDRYRTGYGCITLKIPRLIVL